MIFEAVYISAVLAVTFLVAAIVHEVLHVVWFWAMGYEDVRVSDDSRGPYVEVPSNATKSEVDEAGLVGVVGGLAMIGVVAVLVDEWFVFGSVVPYGIGCWHDLGFVFGGG